MLIRNRFILKFMSAVGAYYAYGTAHYEDTKPQEILLTFGSVVMLFPFVILESYKRAQTLTIPETFVAADMESRENR